MVQSIEQFYETNKSLSRKDYTILINDASSIKKYLELLMNLYSTKVTDDKQFGITHAKDIFGINDNCQPSSQIDAEAED
jgi:NRPS condensation-like uncharacterized protein